MASWAAQAELSEAEYRAADPTSPRRVRSAALKAPLGDRPQELDQRVDGVFVEQAGEQRQLLQMVARIVV